MLKSEEIRPGNYRLRNGSIEFISRIWMGIIYGIPNAGKRYHGQHKHIWINNGNYNIDNTPHDLDIMERVN